MFLSACPRSRLLRYRHAACKLCRIPLESLFAAFPYVAVQAIAAAEQIGDDEVVIKSQILAGGRGLGTFANGFQGGVHVIKTSEVRQCCGDAPSLPRTFGHACGTFLPMHRPIAQQGMYRQ